MLPRPPSPIPSTPQPQKSSSTPPVAAALGRRAERLSVAVLSFLAIAVAGCPGMMPAPPIEPLTPPESGQGFQLKTQPISVDAGQENQDCYFFRVPASTDVFVHRVVLRQRTGSHHLNVFRVGTLKGLRGEDGEVVKGGNDQKNPCWVSSNWSDWPLVINSQSSDPGHETVDYTLPTGVAHKFAAGELLMVQSHYVNATTQVTPDTGEAWLNFEYMPATDVKSELGTFFATNQNLRICPGETKFFEKVCRFGHPATVVAANGHFHSRGTRFSMYAWDETNGKGAQFYDNTSWNDPVMARDLSVPIGDKGGVLYRCEFTAPPNVCGNPADGCCFSFGPTVEISEHCNAFIYFYPRLSGDNFCF